MAKNVIKGLTVEIGGDTTKLGKALENVNKKTRDLSGELSEVNKLLKMDPGNADLLAQKQEILAEAVENTKEKLETLKEAEKQVQKQFERGEVSEEQVRALQREIIATTKKMEGYEKAARETAEELEDLGDGAKDAQKGTKKVEKGADEAEEELEDMADAAEKAGKASEGMGSKLGGVAKGGLKLLAAGVAAAAGALVASAESSREYRTEMGKLDTAFTTAGHSSEAATKTYKSLQGVLGETDQAVEAANHLAKLTDNEKDLQTWTDVCTGVYATFGASLPIEGLTEAANETAKVGQVTGPLADALNWAGVSEEAFNEQLAACSSEQERQTLIMETLNGLYSDAAEKYKETNAEVIRANEANEAWASSMAEIGGVVEPILTDIKMLGASLLSDLVPGVKAVAEAFRGMINGDEGAAANLGTALSGIFEQLLNKITELLPAVAEMAISLVTTLATSIINAVPQLINTGVEVVLALIQGLTQAIPQIITAITNLIPQLVQALVTGIPLLIQGAVDLLLAIVQAIPQIIPPLVAALPQLVLAIINGLMTALPQLLEGAVQFLTAIIQAIPQIISLLVPQIPAIVTAIIDGLIANIPVLLEGALQLLHAIVDAIPLLLDALLPQIPTIIDTLVAKLLEMAPVWMDTCITLFMALVEAIPQIVVALVNALPQILQAVVSVLSALPRLFWGILTQVIDKVKPWVVNLAAKAKEAGSKFINGVVEFVKNLPYKIGYFIGMVIGKVATFAVNMATKAKEAGSKFINGVVNFVKTLPSKLWTWLQNAIAKVVNFGTQAVSKAKTAAKNILNAVVNGVKSLPDKIKSIGKNLVEGLWNGITNAKDWLIGKIKGFTDGVLDGIKDFFGVHSPSRETAWIGEMLDRGLAAGIEDNADAPLDAMTSLGDDLLGEADAMNGLTLERRLNTTFNNTGADSAASGLLAKLDSILAAIERGQILTIDGGTLVGATAGRMDSTLGQRRTLAARGAL